MQTFLPYYDIVKSLECLDDKRLGKQRSEADHIYRIVKLGLESRWKRHPTVLMWKGYGDAIAVYRNMALRVWADRGFRNIKLKMVPIPSTVSWPSWIGDERFHASHRSNLLRKKPEWYGRYNWTEPPDLPYFWPTKEGYAIGRVAQWIEHPVPNREVWGFESLRARTE